MESVHCLATIMMASLVIDKAEEIAGEEIGVSIDGDIGR